MHPSLWQTLVVVGAITSPIGASRVEADDPWSEMRTHVAPILANVPATGLLVFEVVAESQAAANDIRVGDILTHYDGQPVESHFDLSELARAVHRDSRSEILIILHRAGEEIEKTLGPGPMGLRLEDVVAGEQRTLPEPQPPARLSHARLRGRIAKGSHLWWLVKREGQVVGWQHHYFCVGHGGQPTLRIQDFVQFGEHGRRGDRVIAFSLDDLLSPLKLRTWYDDRPSLDATWQGDSIAGTRLSIPVRMSAAPRTTLAELAPYLAEGMMAESVTRSTGSFLSLGLSAAPLSEIAQSRTQPGTVVVRTLGREQMRIQLAPDDSVKHVIIRGGYELVTSTYEAVSQTFGKSLAEFTSIEEMPAAPPTAAPQAN